MCNLSKISDNADHIMSKIELANSNALTSESVYYSRKLFFLPGIIFTILITIAMTFAGLTSEEKSMIPFCWAIAFGIYAAFRVKQFLSTQYVMFVEDGFVIKEGSDVTYLKYDSLEGISLNREKLGFFSQAYFWFSGGILGLIFGKHIMVESELILTRKNTLPPVERGENVHGQALKITLGDLKISMDAFKKIKDECGKRNVPFESDVISKL